MKLNWVPFKLLIKSQLFDNHFTLQIFHINISKWEFKNKIISNCFGNEQIVGKGLAYFVCSFKIIYSISPKIQDFKKELDNYFSPDMFIKNCYINWNNIHTEYLFELLQTFFIWIDTSLVIWEKKMYRRFSKYESKDIFLKWKHIFFIISIKKRVLKIYLKKLIRSSKPYNNCVY